MSVEELCASSPLWESSFKTKYSCVLILSVSLQSSPDSLLNCKQQVSQRTLSNRCCSDAMKTFTREYKYPAAQTTVLFIYLKLDHLNKITSIYLHATRCMSQNVVLCETSKLLSCAQSRGLPPLQAAWLHSWECLPLCGKPHRPDSFLAAQFSSQDFFCCSSY